MCTSLNEEDFIKVYYQMAHIVYYMAYKKQDPLFKKGANPAFQDVILS